MVVGDSQVQSRTRKGHGQWKVQSIFMQNSCFRLRYEKIYALTYSGISAWATLLCNRTYCFCRNFDRTFHLLWQFVVRERAIEDYERSQPMKDQHWKVATNERSAFPPMFSGGLRQWSVHCYIQYPCVCNFTIQSDLEFLRKCWSDPAAVVNKTIFIYMWGT